MSDYLWDKTGEPEADVEQLENLLGALKYKQRPLEIPAAMMPARARVARRAHIFSRPQLAIAASLLLMLLAGIWFITRQDEAQKNQVVKVEQTSPVAGSEKPETANVLNNESRNFKELTGFEQAKPREDRAGIVMASTRKPQRAARRSNAKRQKLQSRMDDSTPATQELVAANGAAHWQVEEPLTSQQREATRQLMLALSVASAKFNYAQREMLEIGRGGK